MLEGGGQEGDIGSLKTDMGNAQVIDTKKLPDGSVYNIVHVTEGSLHVGDTVEITVDMENKLASARNHTATHLLQAALKTCCWRPYQSSWFCCKCSSFTF